MKKIIFSLLSPTFGSKKFKKFYEILKNISLVGLNYRNTNIKNNGELFFIKNINNYYKDNAAPIVLFDIGANIGNYSKQLNDSFSQNRHIYAFEPFSKVYSELKKLENTIPLFYPFQIGLSDKVQKLKFLSSSDYSEVGGLYNKDFSKDGFSLDLSEDVDFDTVDNFCLTRKINHIHFLKVDVEGHDLFVLKGAEKMLLNNQVDFIQFEFGAANYLSKTYLYDFFQLLSPQYHIYKLLRNGLLEIKEYNTDIEIHVLSNYVAINKNLKCSFS